MTGFVMPKFYVDAFTRTNYQKLLLALGLTKSCEAEAIALAEAIFDQLVPKMLIDGEEFAVTRVNREIALFAYGQSRAQAQACFRMTREMRVNFINYLTRGLAWKVLLDPDKYPLEDRMLRRHADVEVVVRQPAHA